MIQNQDNLKLKQGVSPLMLLSIVAFWGLLNLFFVDRYIKIVENQSTLLETLFACMVVSWIALTSFYASFHFISFFPSLVRLCSSLLAFCFGALRVIPGGNQVDGLLPASSM